ncbi:hypothetical protein DV515_00012957 [Chloebia gouldiae]|uniref:Uncharacterized protein n=1 Tax=Chloebia gouldiae TaxID=44316 RepID=A0A3L8S291_CHLGU|nr:hypothetical protein DV515_00012957 [Chloebia gouldiae]
MWDLSAKGSRRELEKEGLVVGMRPENVCWDQCRGLELSWWFWQIPDALGTEKFCGDAGQGGAGNWLKYIRVSCSCDEQNLAVCHTNEQVTPGAAGLPWHPARPGGSARAAGQWQHPEGWISPGMS